MSCKKEYFKVHWFSPCKHFLLVHSARDETQVIFVWRKHSVLYGLQLSRQKYRPTQMRSKSLFGILLCSLMRGEMQTILWTCLCHKYSRTRLKWGFCSSCSFARYGDVQSTKLCLCFADNWYLMALSSWKLCLNLTFQRLKCLKDWRVKLIIY